MAQFHMRSMFVAFVFRGELEERSTEQMEERPSWQKKPVVRGKQPTKKERELKDVKREGRATAFQADNAENKPKNGKKRSEVGIVRRAETPVKLLRLAFHDIEKD